MSDLTKNLAENQNEMLKLVAPAVKKPRIHQNGKIPTSKRKLTILNLHQRL